VYILALQFKIEGYDSSVAGSSGLVECDAVLISKQFPVLEAPVQEEQLYGKLGYII